METPFDAHAARANKNGYHNHRDNSHSDIISDGIVEDLKKKSPMIKMALENGTIGYWKNQPSPWGRERDTDLVLAEPMVTGKKKQKPDMKKTRLMVEHKSVVTAHRNRDARYDDLNNLCKDAALNTDIIVAATVMIGISDRFLNVADKVKNNFYRLIKTPEGKMVKLFLDEEFDKKVLTRIMAHDEKLWDEYSSAVSLNKKKDIEATLSKFKSLPIRSEDDRAKPGLDALLLVPVFYDNVNPAYVARDNPYSIDVDKEYDEFLLKIVRIYEKEYD